MIPTSFITTLHSFIRNLKTLNIEGYPCESIDLLKMFENLEHLELSTPWNDQNYSRRLVPMNDIVAKNLKHLEIYAHIVMDPSTATKITKDYPNLESIILFGCVQLVPESEEILKRNLKKLKQFYVQQQYNNRVSSGSERVWNVLKRVCRFIGLKF